MFPRAAALWDGLGAAVTQGHSMGAGRTAARSKSPSVLFFFSPLFPPFPPPPLFFFLSLVMEFIVPYKKCKRKKEKRRMEEGQKGLQRMWQGCRQGVDAVQRQRGLCSTEGRPSLSSFSHPKELLRSVLLRSSQSRDGAAPHQEPPNEAVSNEPHSKGVPCPKSLWCQWGGSRLSPFLGIW